MAKQTEIKNPLLAEAITAFHRLTDLRLTVKQKEGSLDGTHIDAIVQLNEQDPLMAVAIKKWAVQTNLGALIHQVKNLPVEGLLVADFINANMADKLREQGVQFIDTAGNAYINRPPVYVFVTGQRQKAENHIHLKEETGRAFAVTGLKVIYAFLCEPALVDAPYRVIAEVAGVANGTVGWVLNDLKAAGYVIDRGKNKGRRLENYHKLLDRWVEQYPVKLRPKLNVGEFIAEDSYWWKEIELKKYGGYWGGEVAAAKITHHLKPEVVTIYLPGEAGNQLLAAGKLRKRVNRADTTAGLTRIYRPFWTEQHYVAGKHNKQTDNLVHPVLVYADLIATGDSRNREVATIIHDQFIIPIIGQT